MGFMSASSLWRKSLIKVCFLFFLCIFAVPVDALAFPFFSRQVGRDCTYCHTLFPKLNETGRTFRGNGYRFEGEGEWKEVKDWTILPAAVEVEVEGIYNRFKSSGVRSESSDLKIEEINFISGGAIGKTGKVSALASIIFSQTDTGTDTRIGRAFVQVNDLDGSTGKGLINLRAGQWDIGLPFLNPVGVVITNAYLAETAMNVITPEQRAIEVNGSIITDEGSLWPTHRYSAGLARSNVNGDDKLRDYYATYSATINEDYSIGAIYRGGREKIGALDTSYNKYGIAGEAEAGSFILTAAYFKSDRSGANNQSDYLIEALYKVLPKLSFAARYELLKEKDKKGAKSQSFMARYNILSNVFAQLELRGLSDDDHITGTNEDEQKARLLLVAVF